MNYRIKKLSKTTIALLMMLGILATALAITYFYKQIPSRVNIVSDYTLTVDPSTLDFGDIELNSYSNRTVTITYIGTNETILAYWYATGLPEYSELTCTMTNGTLFNRNDYLDATFTFYSHNATAGEYYFDIYITVEG